MKTLRYGDEVVFYIKEGGETLEYVVADSYLSFGGGDNDTVFIELGIAKNAFCNQHYGYTNLGRDWPECRKRDYKALTRCVAALAKVVAERGGKTLVNGEVVKVFETGKGVSMMSKLKSIPARLKRMLNANFRAFYSLGWVDSDLEITEKGEDALTDFIFDKFEKELGEVAKKEVAKIKKAEARK